MGRAAARRARSWPESPRYRTLGRRLPGSERCSQTSTTPPSWTCSHRAMGTLTAPPMTSSRCRPGTHQGVVPCRALGGSSRDERNMAGGCGRHGQQQGLQEERVCAGETLQFSAVPDIDTHLTHSAGANYIQVEEGCSRSTASPPMLGNSARRLGSPSWPSLAGRPSLQCVAPGPDGAPTVPPRSQSDGTRAEPTRGGGGFAGEGRREGGMGCGWRPATQVRIPPTLSLSAAGTAGATHLLHAIAPRDSSSSMLASPCSA